MFKAAGDNVAYLDRVGSHSTKGARTGAVTVLPREAVVEEAQYRTVQEQYEALLNQVKDIGKKIYNIDLALRDAAGNDAATRTLKRERGRLRAQVSTLQSPLRMIGTVAHQIGEKSYCIVFYYMARAMMDLKAFDELDAATAHALGRIRDETAVVRTRVRAKDRLGLPLSSRDEEELANSDAARVAKKGKRAAPLPGSTTSKPARPILKLETRRPEPQIPGRRADERDLMESAWEE